MKQGNATILDENLTIRDVAVWAHEWAVVGWYLENQVGDNRRVQSEEYKAIKKCRKLGSTYMAHHAPPSS